MIKSIGSLLVLSLTAFTLTMAGTAPAPAAGSDGVWSVLIVTEKGTCDRGYRYPVKITRGVVGHVDPTSSFDIRGRVNGSRINVTVSRGTQSAAGAGRITSTSGSGTWRTKAGDCSGNWTAERRN
jgi:hypothetical protein